ncbi:acyltransferase [Brachyspira pulli]|uniref:acyltransferase family protein n=1 Tax=Brachyspira pulli TaxID=310721 RepID=UPI0030044F4A
MNKRLNNIDFLKIIFTLAIIYGHILQHFFIPQFKECEKLYEYTSYGFGYMCEFLFIISGFFLHKEFKIASTKSFCIKKIYRFWPALAFSIFISYILSRFSLSKWTDINVIPELFFLNNSIVNGIPTITGVAWYVNSLFWVSIFYFIINKIFKDKNIYIVYLITFFSYLAIFNKPNLYDGISFNSFISFYIIRGFAGVGLGILFADNMREKKEFKFNIKYLVLGLLEIAILFFIVLYLSILKIENALAITLVLFIILFYTFINYNSIFSFILNKDKIIIPFLSKYMYCTYIMQFIVFYLLDKILYHNPNFGVSNFLALNIIITMILCFIVGMLSQIIIDKIIYYIQTRPDQTRPDQTRPDQTNNNIIWV